MTEFRQPPPLPPWRLLALTRIAARAGEVEEALAQMVANARAGGHSWQEIGDALGISRQGASQRFGKNHPEEDDDGSSP